MSGYTYAVAEEAVVVFSQLPPRRRARLLRTLESLARYPGRRGDFRESGASGRIYELMLDEDILITWWVDHSSREIRVVRLEFVK